MLIIDESPNVSGFLRDILARKGYTVHAVSDRAKGLMIFKNQKPDLVFVGVGGDGAAGWEVVRDLKNVKKETPIAVLSDDVGKEAEENASSLGCAGLVFRGLKPEVFLQKVLDVCNAHAPLSREAPLETTKGRILVVDDEAVIRTVLSRFLKRKGYAVSTAANGREALELVKKERPHLMLLDIRMPELDGFGVLERIRDVDREIAVMMITANTDLAQAQKSMEMGACDYIVKPFHLDYLETSVMAKLLLVTA